MTTRTRTEDLEAKVLAPYAICARASQGRTLHGNESDDYRTCFQRDRDRILYSKAFRDLQYKTQVFLVSEGDFYRTRLTHTLEVAQHARTLARVLGLNEDLCEAIAYAHDLGHPPFGHAGETALDAIMKGQGGFEHNIQSLRIVDKLEKRYAQYEGLNLSFETREGIARHQTSYDHPVVPKEFLKTPSPSLETQIVNIADPLAYCTHDLEDALSGGLLSFADIERMDNAFLQEILTSCQEKYPCFASDSTQLRSRLLVREIIEKTTLLVVEQTQENIRSHNISSLAEVRASTRAIVQLPDAYWENFSRLKKYLLENVYRTPQVCIMNEKGCLIITRLFEHLVNKPQLLPSLWRQRWEEKKTRGKQDRALADFLASMTDHYAALLYQMMFDPAEKIMFGFQR